MGPGPGVARVSPAHACTPMGGLVPWVRHAIGWPPSSSSILALQRHRTLITGIEFSLYLHSTRQPNARVDAEAFLYISDLDLAINLKVCAGPGIPGWLLAACELGGEEDLSAAALRAQ